MRFVIIAIIFIIGISSAAYSETNTNDQSNKEINIEKKSEPVSENTKNESLYEQSEKYSKELSVKLDRYIEFISSNPATKDVDIKFNEIDSLFSIIGNICNKMGDAEYYKSLGSYVKAQEIENCNDGKYVLAPYVANAIVKTAKYYAGKGDKATAKRMYRDVIVRFTGLKYQSQVKEAEFGIEDLKQ